MDIGNLGTVAVTRGLAASMADNSDISKSVFNALSRYKACDWGDLCDSDKRANDNSVKKPLTDRIFAKYNTPGGDIYIITEYDRSYTTLMFCNEY